MSVKIRVPRHLSGLSHAGATYAASNGIVEVSDDHAAALSAFAATLRPDPEPDPEAPTPRAKGSKKAAEGDGTGA